MGRVISSISSIISRIVTIFLPGRVLALLRNSTKSLTRVADGGSPPSRWTLARRANLFSSLSNIWLMHHVLSSYGNSRHGEIQGIFVAGSESCHPVERARLGGQNIQKPRKQSAPRVQLRVTKLPISALSRCSPTCVVGLVRTASYCGSTVFAAAQHGSTWGATCSEGLAVTGFVRARPTGGRVRRSSPKPRWNGSFVFEGDRRS